MSIVDKLAATSLAAVITAAFLFPAAAAPLPVAGTAAFGHPSGIETVAQRGYRGGGHGHAYWRGGGRGHAYWRGGGYGRNHAYWRGGYGGRGHWYGGYPRRVYNDGYYWRRGYGGYPGLWGFAAGAVLGGALAGNYYGYGDYRYPPTTYYSPGYGGYPATTYYSPGYGGYPANWASWNAYCSAKYRSFDPASGTFLGYDGRRHYCR